MQPKIKEALHDIWMADTRKNAHKAFDSYIKRFEDKYPGAMKRLEKDKSSMLAFYDFPVVHWQHIRTSNPIESIFATVRLRTTRTKNCGSRKTTLAMAWKLMTTAQKNWRRLRGYRLLVDIIRGVKFKDGERVELDSIAGCGLNGHTPHLQITHFCGKQYLLVIVFGDFPCKSIDNRQLSI